MKYYSTDLEWSPDLSTGKLSLSKLSDTDKDKLKILDEHMASGHKVTCDMWIISLKGVVVIYEMVDSGIGGWRFEPKSGSENIEPGCLGTKIYIWE